MNKRPKSLNKPAIFLDRDGTLIEDCGYLKEPQAVVFFSDTLRALQKLQEHFLLFIVTNQSGIAVGFNTLAEVECVNASIVTRFQTEGIRIEEVYVCPHGKDDDCECRKPKDFFLKKAEKDFSIDLNASYSVGDHSCDFFLCESAGGKGAFVLTGHGEKHRHDCPSLHRVFSNLEEATDWIILDHLHKTGSTEINTAAQAIRDGELVVFPTETVYGLGADATNEQAVKKIFALKERPFYDPLIVHIHELSQLPHVCGPIDKKAEKLINAFWPGPLTLVLKKSVHIPEIVTSGLATVGVRMPSHPKARVFLEKCGVPVAAPSANKFGYVSPTEAGHADILKKGVAGILDGGRSRCGIESTIISLENDVPVILRKGVITKAMIEAVIGSVDEKTASSSHPEAPGMLAQHYSPKARVFLDPVEIPSWDGVHLFLSFGKNAPETGYEVFSLSDDGNLEEAAANLYRGLRYADEIGAATVNCFLFPDEGLGSALNDKLRRAASQ